MEDSFNLSLASNLNALSHSFMLDSLTLDSYTLDASIQNHHRSLRFALSPQDNAIVPLEQITEVLSLECSKISPVPEMPPCVLGICNWQGEMLWVIDFCNFVDYSPLLQTPIASVWMVMVVQVDQQSITSGKSQFVGIAVPSIDEIEFHDLLCLQPVVPNLFSSKLLPLILGLLPEQNDPVLNLKAIANCPAWKTIGRNPVEIF
jgi:chemotaxis signal transduction protein